ncbi:MAG: hypothetical protein ACXVP0_08275 [Bacteroidia bacterium]
MAFEDIVFPVYRKYKNNTHFFKIVSRTCFEEVQIIGKKSVVHKLEAKQLPEMNHIFDLVYNYHDFGS